MQLKMTSKNDDNNDDDDADADLTERE